MRGILLCVELAIDMQNLCTVMAFFNRLYSYSHLTSSYDNRVTTQMHSKPRGSPWDAWPASMGHPAQGTTCKGSHGASRQASPCSGRRALDGGTTTKAQWLTRGGPVPGRRSRSGPPQSSRRPPPHARTTRRGRPQRRTPWPSAQRPTRAPGRRRSSPKPGSHLHTARGNAPHRRIVGSSHCVFSVVLLATCCAVLS